MAMAILRSVLVAVCATVANADFHGARSKAAHWYYDPKDAGWHGGLSFTQLKRVAKAEESAEAALSKLLAAKRASHLAHSRQQSSDQNTADASTYYVPGHDASLLATGSAPPAVPVVGNWNLPAPSIYHTQQQEIPDHAFGEAYKGEEKLDASGEQLAPQTGLHLSSKKALAKSFPAESEHKFYDTFVQLDMEKHRANSRKKHWRKGDEVEWDGMMSRLMDRKVPSAEPSVLSFTQLKSVEQVQFTAKASLAKLLTAQRSSRNPDLEADEVLDRIMSVSTEDLIRDAQAELVSQKKDTPSLTHMQPPVKPNVASSAVAALANMSPPPPVHESKESKKEKSRVARQKSQEATAATKKLHKELLSKGAVAMAKKAFAEKVAIASAKQATKGASAVPAPLQGKVPALQSSKSWIRDLQRKQPEPATKQQMLHAVDGALAAGKPLPPGGKAMLLEIASDGKLPNTFTQLDMKKRRTATSLGEDIIRKLKVINTRRARDLWLAEAQDTRKQNWRNGDEDEWDGMMGRMMGRTTVPSPVQASNGEWRSVQAEDKAKQSWATLNTDLGDWNNETDEESIVDQALGPNAFVQVEEQQDAEEDKGMYEKAQSVAAFYGVNKYSDSSTQKSGNHAGSHDNGGFVDL